MTYSPYQTGGEIAYWFGDRCTRSFLWYKKQVPLWLERFILPICAAVVFGVVILNPLKLDWQQRLALFIAISAFAYFLAHTIHKPKIVAAAESEQRMTFLESEVRNLQSQQV